MLNVLATLQGPTLLLAQPDAASTDQSATTGQDGSTDGTGNGTGESSSPFGGSFIFIIIGMMVLWIFLLGGGSRKQKKKQAQLLASMTKGSKVVTIGGIRGSVVEVRDDEVVVKVDENNNTRMKFSRDAIRSVVSETDSND